MKYYFYLLLCIGTIAGCNVKKKHSTRKTEQTENYSPVIKKQIEQLHNEQKMIKEIKLKKNVYHFFPDGSFEKELYISNHDQDNPKKVAFYFENLKNLIIDGNGSEFVFHGTMIPFVMKNCENVTLKNFSIDFELPHLRQLTVLSVDKQNDISTVQIEPKENYEIKDEKLFIKVDDYQYTPQWVMAFRNDKRLSYKRADVDFVTKKIREISSNELEIQGWSQNKFTSVGERFVLRSYHRPTPGIVIDYCKKNIC